MTAPPKIAIPMDALADICRGYHVRELALFGSVLRDDFRADSDVDVLVEFEPGARVGFLEMAGLQEELMALLGRPIDIVSKPGLHPLLRAGVLDSAEILYAA